MSVVEVHEEGRFERLLRPRAIAVVGASPDPASLGGMPLAALQDSGYRGALYPVSPTHKTIAGLRCYAEVGALPGPCDVALVAVRAEEVAGVVDECDRAGIGFAVVLTAGFGEAGQNGHRAQMALEDVMQRARIRLLGPNCQGFLNLKDKVPAGYSSIFELPTLPRAGPIAMVTQSGFGLAIAGMAEQSGLGVNYVVSTGNELDVDLVELLDEFLDRDDVTVAWAFLQGVSDGRRLADLGDKALRTGKPVLVWKIGNSESGRRAAISHTGGLTSDYRLYRAAFRRGGFIEVFDPDTLFDISGAWQPAKLPTGVNAAIVSISGGQAIAVLDRCEAEGVRFPELSEPTLRRLAELAPEFSSLGNPLDVSRQVIHDPVRFNRLVTTVVDDPAIHQVVVCNGAIHGATAQRLAQELAVIATGAPKPVLVAWAPRPGAATDAMKTLADAHVPCFASPSRLAATAGALASFARKRRARADPLAGPVRRGAVPLPSAEKALGERLAKAVLSVYGIPVVREVLWTRSDVDSFVSLPFDPPLAVKVSSHDILHKTDVGLVRLGIRTLEELRETAGEVLDAAEALPGKRIEGVLVQEMADGLEVMLGAVNDASFGPVVTFGLGGVWVEALDDVAVGLAPLDAVEARALIMETRGAALLMGARGTPPLDIDALALALAQLSWLVADHADRIEEVDVNPLFVRPVGLGVVAADALVVLRDALTLP